MKQVTRMREKCVARGLPALMLLAAAILAAPTPSSAAGWKAGAATVVITPDEPVWMAGYGGRTEPSQGKIHDLYAKALVLEDSLGARAVIVTGDIVGYTYEFTDAVTKEIGKRFGIPRNAIFLNASHTHCGPELRPGKGYFLDMPEEYRKKIYSVDNRLRELYIRVISDAAAAMKPADLSFSSAAPVPFAVSRRFPDGKGGVLYRSTPSSYYTGGSRDDVVPVLRVTDPGGAVRAIVFGYACHPITLSIDYFCGDYPGYAQRYIEEAYPGAVAMFVQGCAGELVPNARFELEYAMGHGRALADAVKKALSSPQKPLSGPLAAAYDEVPLRFQPVPERAALEEQAKKSSGSIARKARYLLDRLDRKEPIQTTVPCPVQALQFGKGLLLVGIGGETVVDYAVNVKTEFSPTRPVWVAGYCNYVFGYLPTRKIVQEGGYEGGDALRDTPFPGPFAEDVEDRVLKGVRRLVYGMADVARPEIEVPFNSGGMTIDGSAGDWKAVKRLKKGISFYKGDGRGGTLERYGTTIERTITDEKDLRADVWMAHDGKYLYVLAEIHDDAYESFGPGNVDNMCYQEDMLRIMIDSNNSYQPNITEPVTNQPGYEGFGYSTDGNIYGDWSDFITPGEPRSRPQKGASPDGEYWRAACKVTKLREGYLYTYEERIALSGWPGRNMEPLAPGNSYGLNLEVCDADNGVQLEGYLLWSSDGKTSDFNYENLWGRMHLAPLPHSKR